jgi:hypothetical protein
VHENINQYINIIISDSGDIINDDEDVAAKVINNEVVDDDKKNIYIRKINLKLMDITIIADTKYWDILINNDKIEYHENNIFAYYFTDEHGLNKTLIDFINTHRKTIRISGKEIDQKYGAGSISKLFNSIVECNDLSNDVYNKILCASNRIYNKFTKEQISEDKMLILFETGTIAMTNDNLAFIREKYPDILSSFIVKNIDKYIELIDPDNADFDEILSLLETDINDNSKIMLLENVDEAILIEGKNYSDIIKIYILENNFNYEDIPYLLEIYDNVTDEVRNTITKSMIANIDIIISNEIEIPYSILVIILENAFFDKERSKKILAINVAELDKNQIKKCFEIIELHDYLSLFENKRPKFIVDPVNEMILKVLKDKDIIKKYELDKRNNQYYRAQGKIFSNHHEGENNLNRC